MTCSSCRRPLDLRISITDRCQLRCLYCMPASGVPERPRAEMLSFEEVVRFVRVTKSRFDLAKVRITGGEPLVRRGVVSLIKMLAALEIPDLALTTNGQLLAEMADDLKNAGLRRVNVSLDSLDGTTYAALTRGGALARTLEGIAAAQRAGLSPVKLNMVVLRGINDQEAPALARYALERGCRLRFIELMPIGCARRMFEDRFVPAAELRARLEAFFSMEPLPHGPGQSSHNFSVADASGLRGALGFISPVSEPFCDGCARLRLTSAGEIVTCLGGGAGPSVKALLRSADPDAAEVAARIVADELARKVPRGCFRTVRQMAETGG